MNAAFVHVMLFLQDRFSGRKDKGATAVEYGLLVGLIAVAIITIVATLGDNLATLFTVVSDKLGEVGTGTTAG